MSKESILNDIRNGLKESVDFFAHGKDQFILDSWVVDSFLKNMSIPFAKTDLVRGDDPPDVIFFDAQFEVKEIPDKGRKRHTEYKEALARANNATDPAELLEEYSPKDISIEEVYDRVYFKAAELAEKKYPIEFRKNLDLLFYINWRDIGRIVEKPFPDVTPLKALGYRSVSFLEGYRSCVFCADTKAPSFLHVQPRIIYRTIP